VLKRKYKQCFMSNIYGLATLLIDGQVCLLPCVLKSFGGIRIYRMPLYAVKSGSYVKAYDLRSSGAMKFMFYGQRDYVPFD
jgi:hypothetical protein